MRKSTLIIFILCLMSLACSRKPPLLPSEKSVYHNNRGATYLLQGNLDRAEFELLTAIELNPKYAEAYNNLGIVYKSRGEYEKSFDAFLKAIDIDENYGSAYNQLATLFLSQEKLDDALDAAKKAVKLEPTSADAYYNLGLIWMARAKAEKKPELMQGAESSWKKATELDPSLDYVHVQMAEHYRKKHNYDLAIVRYRLALEAYPTAETWTRLGSLYLEKGDPFKAQNCFQKAIEIDPNVIDPYLQLGKFFLDQNRYQDATEMFQQLTKIAPFNEQAYFYLGLSYLEQTEANRSAWKKAISAFRKAKEINPQYADAIYNLGWAYMKTGSLEQARSEWEMVLTIYPVHLQTLYNLATLAQHEGKRSEAVDHFCRFLNNEKGEFPAERKAAEQIIVQMGADC